MNASSFHIFFFLGSKSLHFGLNQGADMLSEPRAALGACEPPSTTLLPCQRAAQPIPLQYASPPVDLQKNAFHRATDKQNSRWVSLDFCSQGPASPAAARRLPGLCCKAADGGLHSRWRAIPMRRWHKGEDRKPFSFCLFENECNTPPPCTRIGSEAVPERGDERGIKQDGAEGRPDKLALLLGFAEMLRWPRQPTWPGGRCCCLLSLTHLPPDTDGCCLSEAGQAQELSVHSLETLLPHRLLTGTLNLISMQPKPLWKHPAGL